MITPKYALINLTNGEVRDYPISEKLAKDFIGGKMLGARLLYDLMPKGVDALAPEAYVIVNTGPATGTGAPSSGRFNMSFKNVLTGGIASSNCGGFFGSMLKYAGYDGLILTGKAKNLSKIEILEGKITITECPELKGLDSEETQEKLPKHWGKLVIGQAGENLVNYACAVSGERVAGRCGAGAVLGAKNIKAIAAFGTKRPIINDKDKFHSYIKKWAHYLKNHPMTGSSASSLRYRWAC